MTDFELFVDNAMLEYMRWLYAAPTFTFLFTAFFAFVLSMTLVDSVFGLVRRFVK